MTKYSKLISFLESTEDWKVEEDFFIDVLIYNNLKLLEKINLELDANRFTIVPLLLRQFHENIIILLGLTMEVYTLDDFVNKKHNPNDIMEKIKNKIDKKEIKNFNKLNKDLKDFKNLLNKYSHTNIDIIIFNFFKKNVMYTSIILNKMLFYLITTYLEIILIASINKKYNHKINLPNIKGFESKIDYKRIFNDEHKITMPRQIENAFEKFPAIKKHYSSIKEDIQELITKFNKIDNSIESLN